MPTISVPKTALSQLLGRPVRREDLEAWLPWVKGELKGEAADGEAWRVELNDTNRPDLWCVEGIARQIRGMLTGQWPQYPFFQ